MRKQIVAGNWKMNKDLKEGEQLTREILEMVKKEVNHNTGIVLAPPFIHLNSIAEIIKGNSLISLGAQNCHQQPSGAFTGEISASMLKSLDVQYVILGHSERREHFQESDELLAQKIDIVLENGMIPIFCCGESLETREANQQVSFVNSQLQKSLFHLSEQDFQKIVIAYEPIWAIGTGKTATSDQAQEMHANIREQISNKYGQRVADDTTILYGGSCKPSNAGELFAQPDVDGGLIGGASLKARDFVDIIKAF